MVAVCSSDRSLRRASKSNSAIFLNPATQFHGSSSVITLQRTDNRRSRPVPNSRVTSRHFEHRRTLGGFGGRLTSAERAAQQVGDAVPSEMIRPVVNEM